MKQLLTIISSFIAIQFTYSQKQIQVVDSLTGKGLPFTTIECFEKKWGLYTDSAGFATIPENMLQETHKVSYVGYQSKEINFTTTNSIALNRLPQKLEDVTVASCKETIVEKLEIEESKERQYLSFLVNSGCAWATYVPNTFNKEGKIETLSYTAAGFYKEVNADAPIRLRFFEYDSLTKLPGLEISTDNIIHAPKKLKRVIVDLENYNIYIPLNGIVIAFEMFDAGVQYHYFKEHNMADGSKKIFEHYGWSLKAANSKNVIGFNKSPGKPWINQHDYKNNEIGFAPAVALEIKVCK